MLMIRWNERADNKDNEKYLLMIAYLIGISTGVHLMSVLAIVPVVMIILFRKYVNDEESLKKTGYIFLGHAVIILLSCCFLVELLKNLKLRQQWKSIKTLTQSLNFLLLE